MEAMKPFKFGDRRLPSRFWRKTRDRYTGCWEWVGCRNPGGYGLVTEKGVHLLCHRVAYHNLVGPIPAGLVLDHLCRNRSCVNPAHLEPVTIAVNNMRGNGKAATQARSATCPNGHPKTPENTMPDGYKRRCRLCYEAAIRVGVERARHRRQQNEMHAAGRCGCHGQSDVAADPVSTCVALGQECAHKGEG